MKKLLIIALMCATQISAMHDSLVVIKDGVAHGVNRYDVCSKLRDRTPSELQAFINHGGRFKVSELSDGSFKVSELSYGKGGGPIFGAIGYFGTKAVAYGAAIAGLTAGAAAGGTAVAVAVAGETLGAAAGAGVAAEVIAQAGLAGAAQTGVMATLSSGMGVTAAVAAVESAATGVGVALGSCPFLP